MHDGCIAAAAAGPCTRQHWDGGRPFRSCTSLDFYRQIHFAPPAPAEIPVAHAILAEERDVIHEQPPDPTQTMPFPDALLQVGWVVQVSAGRLDAGSWVQAARRSACAWSRVSQRVQQLPWPLCTAGGPRPHHSNPSGEGAAAVRPGLLDPLPAARCVLLCSKMVRGAGGKGWRECGTHVTLSNVASKGNLCTCMTCSALGNYELTLLASGCLAGRARRGTLRKRCCMPSTLAATTWHGRR